MSSIQIQILILIFRDPNLTLVEAPALQPGDVFIDANAIQAMNQELEEAAQMDLPEGDEEAF